MTETPETATCARCGHPAADHEAGECWAHVDGDQCSCAWYTPEGTADPLSARCPSCLAEPGQQCYATSTDEPRRHPHRLRGLAAAKNLTQCEACHGIGWRPAQPTVRDDRAEVEARLTPETAPEVAKIARDLWQALPRVPEIEDVAALLEEHVYPAIERRVRAKVAEEIAAYARTNGQSASPLPLAVQNGIAYAAYIARGGDRL